MTRQPLIFAIWPAIEPVAAEQTQREVGRHAGWNLVHPAEDFSVGRDIVLPAEAALHDVAHIEVRMTRLEYLPDSKGCHNVANWNLREVGVAPHPDALRRIDR